ncbi:elongation factor G [Sneathiella chinensis]|uniref:Elongation factor G n=1 Tax=Sneathiella chinensis TaxID=349750 RepID=A0ABQ5U273_9PROT|nr:elongation factor G [Sneathiella chinensis]GLQ06259.1 elongation factor G [Sneathiella chinensis]
MSVEKPTGPRSIALVGPYSSGKTTLLESLLSMCGETDRKGSVENGTSVGDYAREARDRKMSVEVNTAHFSFMGDRFSVLDCPGSVEFLQECENALIGVDAAVLVCDPEPDKVITVAPVLKFLEDRHIPTFVFVNKVDKARGSVQDLFRALEEVSNRDLVLRQVPIVQDGTVTGYVDLASERSYVYKEGAKSRIIEMPPEIAEEEGTSRFAMLETLADFDDHLMEELLEDIEPDKDEVYGLLQQDLQQGFLVPVFMGSALADHGIFRLLKALRHEVPAAAETAQRTGMDKAGEAPVAQVLKTYISPQGGKMSLARVWSGVFRDGETYSAGRIAGIYRLQGVKQEKLAEAVPGDIVAFGRLEDLHTGDLLHNGTEVEASRVAPLEPVYHYALYSENRDEDVKLSAVLNKMAEEDPSLVPEHKQETQELLLKGQGEIHLKVALERIQSKYGLAVQSKRPKVAYKEAIRKGTKQHARFRKQSGGHGQFGDVQIEIEPLPRGGGFEFHERVVGGSVPRQFIPAVESGVKDYLVEGPLGFPVVDVAVTLFDGQHHSVDSSENSFRSAARIAMSEGMPKCSPVLLEPIHKVELAMPSLYTSKVTGIVSSRRGQILGFDAREGWPGWDVLTAMMPEEELHDLIIDLRSATLGVGTFRCSYDHLQELTGHIADKVVQAHGG